MLNKFQQRCPACNTKKIPMLKDEWTGFIESLLGHRGWQHNPSNDVIVYREALQQPFQYIGGVSSFQLYLNQLFHFNCSSIPLDNIDGYVADNHSEVLRLRDFYKAKADPENLWRVSIIATNHLEIIPLRLIKHFGEKDILGGDKRVHLTVHNTSAKFSERHGFEWTNAGIADYMDDNSHHLKQLYAAMYERDLQTAVANQDLIIVLWSMRQEIYKALEGRTYALRSGMSQELLFLIAQEIHNEFANISKALQICGDLEHTKILLASSRLQTPLCAVGTYLYQKLNGRLPASHILVSAVALDRSYRSAIGEQLGVRTADVFGTTAWGNLGGTMMLNPTNAEVYEHRGVIECPKTVKFSRPLLQVFSNAQKLQIDFSVDGPMRQHYREMLESTRCSSILTAETCVDILSQWFGNGKTSHQIQTKTSVVKPLAEWFSLGVVTSSDKNWHVPPGYVIVVPVNFNPDGKHVVSSEKERDEIGVILQKAFFELKEFLAMMKRNFDTASSDLVLINNGLPDESALPMVKSLMSGSAEMESTGHADAMEEDTTGAQLQIVLNVSSDKLEMVEIRNDGDQIKIVL
ncbi:uncharacterized protein LOC129595712 isoform X2 [Paramacrobiotus metropolitanus]|nr:uncharacterized protein LOC129595712 isoform X2 [Paramacrobiotus metropolitanus]